STPLAFYGTGGGNDVFNGGGGSDSFLFAIGDLNASDTVIGGGANDTLWITTNGTVNTGDLAGVSGIEGVFLQSGGTFHFINGLTSGTSLVALGSSAVDTFDGSGVTTYALTFKGSGGADVMTGGTQNDQFFIPDSAFASIDGGAGSFDRIVLASAAQSFDLSANAAKITNTEIVDLTASAGASLNLAAADIAQVNATGNLLYVVGGADDTATIGYGWSLTNLDVTNPAVSLTDHFTLFHNANGSDLYIDRNVQVAPVITSYSGAATATEPVDEN